MQTERFLRTSPSTPAAPREWNLVLDAALGNHAGADFQAEGALVSILSAATSLSDDLQILRYAGGAGAFSWAGVYNGYLLPVEEHSD